MRIVLVGYRLSQCLIPMNKYLASKYLKGFDIEYINYTGDIMEWGKYLSIQLCNYIDKYIIFSLDDFLVNAPIDMEVYENAFKEMSDEVVCIKLHHCSEGEHLEYPVVAQYCLWEREYLIWILNQVSRPWDFEFDGQKLFNKKVLLRPCISYFTNSAISGRWHGIRLDGLSMEDLKYIRENKLIKV